MHSIRGRSVVRAAVAAAAGWIAEPSIAAVAEPAPEVAVLPDVVVTASRAPRAARDVPATVHSLDAAAALESGARTLPDVLDGIPSVMLQKTSHGQGSPYLRGFTGFRTLALIDGVRLNNSVFRDGPNQYWNTIDPLSLRSVELAMGAASALYGSDAIGGTVHALTIDPPEFDGGPVWRRRVVLRGSTAERSGVGRVEFSGRPDESVGFAAGLSLKTFGDLEGGRRVGRQRKTGYDEIDGDAKLVWYLDADSRLTLAHQSVLQEDAWRTHRTVYGIEWRGAGAGDDRVHSFDQRRDLTYARFETDLDSCLADTLDLTLSRHAQGEDLRRVRGDSRDERQGFDVAVWGASLQLTRSTDFASWAYGAEIYIDDVSSYGRKYNPDGTLKTREIQGPVADDASYESFGVYVQPTIPCLGGALDLVPGVRYTHNHADADAVKDPAGGGRIGVDGSWDAWTGSLRALLPLTSDRAHVLFAGVGQGFRAPNLSDLTRFDTARSNEIETPAPDLDPEHFVSSEIGVRSRWKRVRAGVAWHHTAIDDLIVRTPTGRMVDDLVEVTKRNAGAGYVHGVEVSAEWDATDDWRLRLAGTCMEGRADAFPTSDGGKQRDWMTRLMPPAAQIALRWHPPRGRFWAEIAGDFADRADRLSADDRRDTQRIPPGGTPGYAVMHLRGGARLVDGLALAVALENVLDEDHRIHGSGINEPGRNLVATLEWAF